MFRFLFKRAPKREPVVPATPEKPAAPDRAELQRQARDAAMARADALAGDESAAVAFILECEHADARLKAAQQLQRKEHLEKVRDAMRNTDRRVAKLMQQRLEQQSRAQALADKAAAAAAQAERLAAAPQLMLNQVAELDHAWAALADVPEAPRQAFEASRARLAQRLQAQAALQRAVLDAVAELGRLRQAAESMPPEQAQQELATQEARMAAHLQSAEAASLPKGPLQAFEEGVRALRESLAKNAQRQAAGAARAAALDGWEQAAAADPLQLDEAGLRRDWQALPALAPEHAPQLQQRFDDLLARVRAAKKPKEAAPKPLAAKAAPDIEGARALEQAMAAMEEALESGALHAAAEQDKALRALDLKAIRPAEAQLSRLSRLRAELARLQGWARWGGSVSREELLKAAQDLQGQEMPVAELTKKLGSLRERWKELDAASGPAGKDAWLRFDAACTAAYAPVAEHFQKLAEERRQNLERARAMLAEVGDFAASSGVDREGAEVDWKAVAGFCNRASQAWHRLGPIDRRERKAIDAEFADALRLLTDALAGQQRQEIGRREMLIAEVEQLDANSPRATDALRGIQERWQEMARMLPLPRNDEQALWQRFRQACDAMFAERREAAKVADAERRHNLEQKQNLCAALEAAAEAPASSLAQRLRESEQAWRGIGPVPRADQQALEERFAAAADALKRSIEQAREQQSQQQAQLLQQKLALCRQAEQAAIDGRMQQSLAELRTAWDALPATAADFEKALRARFDAALAGAATREAMERGAPDVLAELLQLEILLGVESPPALAQERLKQQVQVLQSSLRAGQRPLKPQALLLQICERAALLDDENAARLQQLLRPALSQQ
jgi:hypothetical protein